MRHYFYGCYHYYFDSKYYFQLLSIYLSKYFDEHINVRCFGEMNSSNLSYNYTLATHVYYEHN